MTDPRLRFIIAAISLVGLAHSGPSGPFAVLRQSIAASDHLVAADSGAVSADGRFVAFVSSARLLRTDTRRVENIYVFDRIEGAVSLETSAVDGSVADGASHRPMLSADGRFLVFASYATNLLDAADTNASNDVFLRDRRTGTTRRISIGTIGEEADGASDSPAISNDGDVIAFASTAPNLARGVKTHGGRAIYLVRNRTEPTPVSVHVDNSDCFAPALSGDGRVIAFVSSTFDRKTIVVRDLRANTTTCITCDVAGDSTGIRAYDPHLSGDGRLAVFTVARDRTSRTDIAVHDRSSSRTTLITRGANASSTRARISGNGRFIAFQSLASNLACSHRCRGAENDRNLLPDIYVFDRHTETFARVSSDVEEWWVPSLGPWLDAEGRTVVFSSRQPFDADDPTTDFDLFVRTLDPPATVRR